MQLNGSGCLGSQVTRIFSWMFSLLLVLTTNQFRFDRR